jgi:4'-phosphopantetheinyl transferase
MQLDLDHWKLADRVTNFNSFVVHVWRANIDQPSQIVQELGKTLSEGELTRARRFAFQRDRSRFIASHGILRQILGNYLNTEPAQLEFGYQVWGKPYLSGRFETSGIRFNFSHSRSMALFAFAHEREVGIDLEFIQYQPDLDRIASKYFSPNEYELLKGLPRGQEVRAFFACWTRREAYLKALGVGLTYPTDGFDVSMAPGETPDVLRVQDNPYESARWRLEALYPAPGYAAALAVEGHEWQLICWEYSSAVEFDIASA